MLQVKPKPTNLVENYHWIYLGDPAIDTEHEQFEELWEQAEDACDYSKVPTKQGQSPTLFELRHLGGDEVAFLRDYATRAGENQVRRIAARMALESISDFRDATGKKIDIGKGRERLDGVPCPDGLVASRYMDMLDAVSFVDSEGNEVPGQLVAFLGTRVIRSVNLSGK